MTTTLVDFYKNLELAKSLSEKDWTKIISEARHQKMLGRLYFLLNRSQLIEFVPSSALTHLKSAYKVATQQKINVTRELKEIEDAFQAKEITPTILKGAAYVSQGYTCSEGRTFNDIDILVKHALLLQSEIALMVAGWIHKKGDDYDNEYYRKWTHEIQPMIHNKRFTVVDLHHNVLPPTNKSFFPVEQLTVQKTQNSNLDTLTPLDLFIHCSLHLFTEGEFNHPLRDITDLSLLLDDLHDQYSIDDIQRRADELGVLPYVELALYFSVPFCLNLKLKHKKYQLPQSTAIRRLLIIPAFNKVFTSSVEDSNKIIVKLASLLLFIRGHYIRMPLKILVPHLIKKWIQNKKKASKLGDDWS